MPKTKKPKKRKDQDISRAAVVPYESFETLNRMDSLKQKEGQSPE
jgi:hypothetical protein